MVNDKKRVNIQSGKRSFHGNRHTETHAKKQCLDSALSAQSATGTQDVDSMKPLMNTPHSESATPQTKYEKKIRSSDCFPDEDSKEICEEICDSKPQSPGYRLLDIDLFTKEPPNFTPILEAKVRKVLFSYSKTLQNLLPFSNFSHISKRIYGIAT